MASVAQLARFCDLPKDFDPLLHNPLTKPFTPEDSLHASFRPGAQSTKLGAPHIQPQPPQPPQPPHTEPQPQDGVNLLSPASYTAAAATGLAFTPCNSNTSYSPGSHHTAQYGSILEELDPDHRFSNEVMAKALELRIEQEKSRQAQRKVELSHMVLQLMREAATHGICSELIGRLFLDGDLADIAPALGRSQVSSATPCSKPNEEDSARKRRLEKLPVPRQQPLPTSTGLTHRLAYQRQAHQQVLPLLENLPPSKPDQRHPDQRQPDPLAKKSPVSDTGLPPKTGQQILPLMQLHPQLYPMYYTVPEKAACDLNGSASESLSLPFAGRSYSSLLYPSQPQYMPSLHQVPPATYFYVNSAQPHPLFLVQPLSGKAMTRPSSGIVKEEESKRRKLAKNINFMITTPKNPPAKKYNK